ncbi:MAG: DUF1501 domain-containing protein, partial [Planctomycetaceae bacterium]
MSSEWLPSEEPRGNRRHFLAAQSLRLGTLACAWTAATQTSAAPPKPVDLPSQFDLQPKAPAAAPQAEAMISFFMQGGPSHL